MASKRSISPGPIDLMKEIMKLIAEPNSVNSKKKQLEVTYFEHPSKVINHDYCDACFRGGEIICCDKCPRSYHINCHVPIVNKLPNGKWFCKGCAFIGNDEFNPQVPINNDVDKTEKDVLCQYNYIDRDKFEAEMLPSPVNRIIGNCDCPKCIDFTELKSRMKEFFTLGNPCLVTEKFLEELPIQRKYNMKLPAHKQLDKLKMARKNDRCFVCKRGILRGRLVQCHYCYRLYHLNCLDPPIRDWDHSMRWMCPEHNKFFELVYPDLFSLNCGERTDATSIKRLRCELPSLPVNTSFNIPSQIDAMYKKLDANIPSSTENSSLNILCDVASFALETINSSYKINNDDNISNDISVKFLASQHFNKLKRKNNLLPKQPNAILSCISIPNNISIKKKTLTIGKSLRNNLCLLHYGNCEFISDYHATITFDNELGDYLMKNHSRHGVIVDNVAYFGNHRPKDLSNSSELKKINSQVKKYINKRRRLVWRHNMIRIHQNNESENVIIKYIRKRRKFNYRPLDKYYKKKLKNIKHSYGKIQCGCSKRFVPKDGFAGQALLRNESIISIGCMQFKFMFDTYSKEIPKGCAQSSPVIKQYGAVRCKPLNGKRLQFQPEQENSINVSRETRNKLALLTINGHCSFENADDKNSCNEQNHNNTFDLDNGFSNGNTEVDFGNDCIIIHDPNRSTSNINISSLSDKPCTKHWNTNGLSNKIQSCFASDLIQEFEVNELCNGDETIEEEILYQLTDAEADNTTAEHISDVQDWIIEEIVVEEDRNCNGNELEHSVDLQSSSTVEYPVPDNHRDYKTEHLYCVRSPSYDQPIIISDDDDE